METRCERKKKSSEVVYQQVFARRTQNLVGNRTGGTFRGSDRLWLERGRKKTEGGGSGVLGKNISKPQCSEKATRAGRAQAPSGSGQFVETSKRKGGGGDSEGRI